MPFLQSLAGDGIDVADAHVPGAGTPSSMPAIMQSRLPIEHGGYGLRLPPEPPTLAEALSDAGVATAGFHSNAYTTADAGFNRGFDAFADLGQFRDEPVTFTDQSTDTPHAESEDGADSPNSIRLRAREAADRLNLRSLGEQAIEPLKRHGLVDSDPRADGELLFESLRNWRTYRSDAEQRFGWLQLMDTHLPYLPPTEYCSDVETAPETFRAAYDLWMDLVNRPETLTDAQITKLRGLYAAEARHVDELLETFVADLKRAGDWESTLLVVTADHGELFGDVDVPYDLPLKHPNYLTDALTHVPLVVAGGAVNGELAGDRVDHVTSGLDIAPTIGDTVGAPIPEAWRGTVIGSDEHATREFVESAVAHTRGSGVSVSQDALHVAVRSDSRSLLWWQTRDETECYTRADGTETPAECGSEFDRLQERAEETAALLDTVGTAPTADAGGAVSQRLQDLGYVE